MRKNLREVNSITPDALYKILKKKIVDFELMPGSSVSETSLAEAHGTSRTTVRATLQRLEMEYLVKVVPQKGTYITYLNYEFITSVMYIRHQVESAAAGALMQAGGAEHWDALEAILDDCAVRRGRLGAGLAAENAFHEKLYSAVGNPYVWQNITLLDDRCARYKTLKLQSAARYQEEFLALHRELLAALRGGEVGRVDTLLHRYFYGDLERLKAELGDDWSLYFSA